MIHVYELFSIIFRHDYIGNYIAINDDLFVDEDMGKYVYRIFLYTQ